jgi:hypothetical protein
MRYDEVRIELSKVPAGGFQTRVSLGSLSSTVDPFVPPEGVDAAGLYQEWFDSFSQAPTPASKRALDARRRKAGESLFQALLASSANGLKSQLNALAQQQAVGLQHGLRIRLILGDSRGDGEADANSILAASSLPHELMFPPGGSGFLARNRLVSIVRTIGTPEPATPMSVLGNLRVLVANAQPAGVPPLGWKEEVARIQKALHGRHDTSVEVLENASFEDVTARLRTGFHIFHFIGHGGHDPNSGQWYLLFEKDGKRQPILAEDIADSFGDNRMLRLAVLNACHSGELAKNAGDDALAGVAAALSVRGVPAVVAMQIAVTDSAAVDFSGAFYGALRDGQSIETAVADGRSSVRVASPEWATPVLYLRGQTSDLFEFEAKSDGPVIREDGPPELKLGIRTLVESEKFPSLADWAKKLETTTEKLLALEEFFEGRFIIKHELWSQRVLPRLNRFLADAVEQDRPLALSLVAHGTVAFAAGFYFHTKSATRTTLIQVTSGQTLRWSETVGNYPKGSLWQSFEETVFDSNVADVAVAIEITQSTSEAVKTFLAQSGTSVGRLISARIAGEPGKTRIESGAHAYQLAWQLQQWLKDHTGNRAQRRLHLFIAAPNGFLFFFGQLAQNLGALRLYEYDFEGTRHGTYEPSLDLPQAASE